MAAQRANVFVVGLDEHNRRVLDDLADVERYAFHSVLDLATLQHGDDIPILELLDRAEQQIRSADVEPDAIIGWWDFPVSLMVPVLCKRFGLPSASLEAVLRCEHKYYSRLVQSEVTDCVPAFAVVDPAEARPDPPLPFPFWLKPVKAFSSELAFEVADRASYDTALEAIREGIDRVGEPFEDILSMADLPEEIQQLGGSVCLAESVMAGAQCTVEGWVHDGEVGVHGIVDSICYPDSPSFLRFELPSTLPDRVQSRMVEATRAVIGRTGLDSCTFNVEFFFDPETDEIGLLEVNPRHSQSHAPLFKAVHDVVNHRIQLQLALGEDPDVPQGRGAHGAAAKWFLRCTQEGEVTRTPTPAEIAAVEEEHDEALVRVTVREGDRLAELHDQDAYSFKLAELYLAAPDRDALVERFQRCAEALPFAVDGEPVRIGAASEARPSA